MSMLLNNKSGLIFTDVIISLIIITIFMLNFSNIYIDINSKINQLLDKYKVLKTLEVILLDDNRIKNKIQKNKNVIFNRNNIYVTFTNIIDFNNYYEITLKINVKDNRGFEYVNKKVKKVIRK